MWAVRAEVQALTTLTGGQLHAATRAWRDQRFDETSPDGVYLAHQPIYGFGAGHCEPALLPRYVRSLEIMRALLRLRFESCLDAGAAEGYKAERSMWRSVARRSSTYPTFALRSELLRVRAGPS